MRVKQITTAGVAIFFATCALTSQADHQPGHNVSGHNWMPQQPTNQYWQAPNWSGFNMNSNNMQPMRNTAPQRPVQRPVQPPMQANNNQNRRPPVAPPGYRPPGPYNQAPNVYRGNQPPPNYRPYPPQRGPNMRPNYRPDSGASAYNMPGYNPYRRNSGNRMPWGGNNNRFGNNKFWGRSGPSKWMNPSKENWENSWDDMINSPSRMGEMPGGWTAPEVTMPNPIDMGDQFQDNLQDLPEQMREGQIGNDVSN